MKIRSPIVTLLVGAGLAGVLLVLDARASSDAQEQAAAAAAPPTVTASAPATVTPTPVTTSAPSPAATTAPVATRPVTYAGHLNGTGSVAVVVRGEEAVAYMCDSQNRVEAWMQGSATDGKVNLSGRQGAQLDRHRHRHAADRHREGPGDALDVLGEKLCSRRPVSTGPARRCAAPRSSAAGSSSTTAPRWG